jgi:hypothetical protein
VTAGRRRKLRRIVSSEPKPERRAAQLRSGYCVSLKFETVDALATLCLHAAMPKHPKRPRDPAQLAKLIVDIATGSAQDTVESDKGPMSALGRAGGLRGGRARAEKLPEERRAEIARQAAAARWRKDDG